MKVTRPTPVRMAQAAALAGATTALAFAFRARPPLFAIFAILALSALATPFLEWTAPPARLVRALPRAHGLLLLTVGTLAWFSRSMGVLVLEPAMLASLAGLIAAPMGLAFGLAPGAFRPGRSLAPATIGLFCLAGLDPAPAGYGASALPFLKGSEHSAFSELYLALAVPVLIALWTSALLDSGPRWRARDLVGPGVALALAGLLAATGIVGLPLLQPHVERAVAEALAQGATGLKDESTLGEFAQLAVSRRRVLDLQTSAENGGPWLLRSEVLTAFDGRRWTNPAPRPHARGRTASTLEPTAAPARVGHLLADIGVWFRPARPAGDAPEALELRINQHQVADWPLLLPRGVVAVTLATPYLEQDRRGELRRPGGIPAQLYGAIVTADPPRETVLTEDERAEALALPSILDARVRALAQALASQAATPPGRLQATLAALRNGYSYTLRPGAFLTRDALAEFLFEKRAGYCEYFATAAVVLLRLQGVPARFVKGLSVGPQTDQGGGLHVVRESDAHAWVEAWLPGEGWVEADPTPPDRLAAAQERAGDAERLFEHIRAALAVAWSRLLARGPLAFLRTLGRELLRLATRAVREPLVWLAAALLALGPRLVRAWRTRRRSRRQATLDAAGVVPAELRLLLREVERRWKALGRPRPASRGLREHARMLAAASDATPTQPLARVAQDVVEAYYRARFGAEAPSAAELARLRDGLRGGSGLGSP